ncbi:hypothetical protein SORBI_3007G116766 [Sorghum bicolor]|uniref:Uncharacterized protein n=1 Tax=Sorghum bicolor TaxID=4558 RepID=A0A1Z5R9C4_SORBI|nr:hypothetical protein SORBI_3007G116766 [Sorghum bicolor]
MCGLRSSARMVSSLPLPRQRAWAATSGSNPLLRPALRWWTRSSAVDSPMCGLVSSLPICLGCLIA